MAFEYPVFRAALAIRRRECLSTVLGATCRQDTCTVFIHLVVIAWLYVALMMAVAEATNTTGTVLGAVFTFLLYGAAPVALVVYLMGAPARRRALKAREASERAQRLQDAQAQAASDAPDQGGEAPADPVAPVRKES